LLFYVFQANFSANIQKIKGLTDFRINLFYKFYLSGSVACLQLFLSCPCVQDAVELLEPHKFAGVVSGGESVGIFLVSVAFHSAFQVTGNAGVENFIVGICRYVGPCFHLCSVC